MKKSILLFTFMFAVQAYCQQQFVKDSAVAFQKTLDGEYADKTKSPLLPADLRKFKGLNYYPVSEKYFINAKFVRTENEKPFEMPTSTDRKPIYVKYGEVYFTLEGKKCKLNIYRNIELSKNEAYKDYLFLPFTDLTSGAESYGGGRYIDLKIPEGENMAIDFNKAYNPYCAYNHKYSCPIPPDENNLKIEIKAGVKKFHD